MHIEMGKKYMILIKKQSIYKVREVTILQIIAMKQDNLKLVVLKTELKCEYGDNFVNGGMKVRSNIISTTD